MYRFIVTGINIEIDDTYLYVVMQHKVDINNGSSLSIGQHKGQTKRQHLDVFNYSKKDEILL